MMAVWGDQPRKQPNGLLFYIPELCINMDFCFKSFPWLVSCFPILAAQRTRRHRTHFLHRLIRCRHKEIFSWEKFQQDLAYSRLPVDFKKKRVVQTSLLSVEYFWVAFSIYWCNIKYMDTAHLLGHLIRN